ncbi:MAG: LysE family translocator [Proteobacteria bacterium]|nr:MAG: LysE family translocator [Pseudomonadota bacterium]
MLMVISLAAKEGLKSAVLFITGLVSGVWFHTVLLLLGVSTLIATMPGALRIMAAFGVIYLLYLAWMTFQERHRQLTPVDPHKTSPKPGNSRYWRGVIMNISNPKVLLFFLAFFPQFAQLNQPGYQFRIVILAVIFIVSSFFAFAMVAWLTSKVGQKQMTNPRYKTMMDWFSVVVFVLLAAVMLITMVL